MKKIEFEKISKKVWIFIIAALLLLVVTVSFVLILSKKNNSLQNNTNKTNTSIAINEKDTKTQKNTKIEMDTNYESNTESKTTTENETSTDSNMTMDDKTNTDNNITTNDKTNTNNETNVQETTPNETVTAQDDTLEVKVEKILNKMTLEQKVYQMFIITPEVLTNGNNVTTCSDYFREQLERYPVGGMVYFANNLVNREQTMQMLQNTRQYAYEVEGMPMFLCVDEEGGRVARIANNPNFGVSNVGAMQYIGSAAKAYEAGQTIGAYLNDLGFNVNFAPDADVLTNDNNTVIGDRSFGTDANIVTEYAAAYSNGLHSQNIQSTFKHFPGHGSTEGDTHEGFAYTNKTYEELMESELVPFAHAQSNRVDFIMAAHISVPNVVGDNTPCTLSYKMISEILRRNLNYNGLVITDAMNMGAISNNYDSGTAAVLAVSAGVDLILMPSNFFRAAQGVINAVYNGQISENRIDSSVRRIITKKLQME